MTNRIFAIIITVVLCTAMVGLVGMVMIHQIHSQDTALIEAQQQTISAQETIIDVQQGLINGLVLENNDKLLELDDYRNRWLEALEG